MNTIAKIGDAILSVMSAWVPGAAVAENVLNVIGVFAGHASALGVNPASPLIADALKVEASVAAINRGDVAILGTVDYDGKKIALFAIDNASALATRMFGTGGNAAGQ